MNVDIALRLEKVRGEIHAAAEQAGRKPDSIRLIAVSKQKPGADIRDAAMAGQRDFGENYLQEALPKIDELRSLALTWHFIGPIQSNKTRAIAENFDWVHTIDRERIARRLSDQRPQDRDPLNICLQVKLQQEDTKSGVEAADAEDLAHAITTMPNLTLRGLMAIPKPTDNFDSQVAVFERLARLRDTVNAGLDANAPPLDVLSMGMSDDMRAAVVAGATHVRIGTAIFGPRKVAHKSE